MTGKLEAFKHVFGSVGLVLCGGIRINGLCNHNNCSLTTNGDSDRSVCTGENPTVIHADRQGTTHCSKKRKSLIWSLDGI